MWVIVCDEVGQTYSCLLGMNVLAEVAEVWPEMYRLSRVRVEDHERKENRKDVRHACKSDKEENWGFVLTGKSQIPIIPPRSTRLIPVWIPSLRQSKIQEAVIEPLIGPGGG